ncbi:CPBP family intramembrane glutamic endopeptidase [Curtobacterium sp. Leaf261]|uniref:CPBP family intramembrane glutamic endopeptidase n=1 Tax=Curtobacterium sp. Leaf261 TaxID=1736311 RepID=UPI0012E1F74C|nr:type II CAAX endopeptidase family protein [Curtobacterium sp. Leaf261]
MSVPYHRLFRVSPRHRWWRPLVALAIFAGLYLVSQVLIAIGFFVPILATSGAAGLSKFARELQDDALSSTDPVVLALTLVSLILLLPAIMWSVKLARLGPYGQLSSIRLRLRWGWMAKCLLPLLVLAIITVGIQSWGTFSVSGGGLAWNHAAIGQSTVTMQTLVITIVMVILLVPFQAAAEEYIFRGFLMQMIGSWIRTPWVGIGVSTLVFAVLHVPNGYNIWGIVDVGSFGLISALLVWRTGGLEAGILAHALNNTVIFVLQAPGWSKVDTSSSNGSWQGAAVTIVTLGLYWLMVEGMARWTHLERRRPGTEAPRFTGTVPPWADSASDGWEAAPALSGPASGSPVPRAGEASIHTS